MQSIDQHIALSSTIAALSTDQELVDSRTEIDHLRFLSDFAELLNFYDSKNEINGNWSPLLLKDPIFLLASMARTPYQAYKDQFDKASMTLERVMAGQPTQPEEKQIAGRARKTGYQQLFDISFDVFTLLVKWTYYMQRYPKEYLLKKHVLQQVTDTYGPLLWAMLQFRDSLYMTKKMVKPKVVRPYTFEETQQYCWLVNKGKVPYWTLLNGLANPNGPADQPLSHPPSTNNNQEVYTALHAATGEVLSFLKQLVSYANEEFKQLDKEPTLYPDTAMFRSFVDLLGHYKQKLNGLSESHLNYYYEDILKQQTLGYKADKVFVSMTLANPATFALPALTTFMAGSYPDGTPAYFRSLTSTVLNPAVLTDAYTLYRQLGDETTNPSLHLTQVEGITKVKKTPAGAVEGWDTFGSTLGQQQTSAFIMASPMLLLKEGARTITLTLNFKQPVSSAFLQQLQFELSTEKGWFAVSPTPPATPDDNTDTSTAADATPATSPTDKLQWSVILTLTAKEPPIVPLPETPTFSSSWPALRISFDQIYTSRPIIDSINIDVWVEGVTGLTLQNDFGTLAPAKPFQPLGPTPTQEGSFYIGSSEIFSKPFNCLTLACNWDKLPPNLYSYYLEYSAYLLWDAYQKSGSTALPESAVDLMFFNNVFKVVFSLGQSSAEWSELQMRNVRWDDVYPDPNAETEDSQYTYEPQCLFTEAYDTGQGPSASCENMNGITATQRSDDPAYTVTYQLWNELWSGLQDEVTAVTKEVENLTTDLTGQAASARLVKKVGAVQRVASKLEQFEVENVPPVAKIIEKLDELEGQLDQLKDIVKGDAQTRTDLQSFPDLNTLVTDLGTLDKTIAKADGKASSTVIAALKALDQDITTLLEKVVSNEEWKKLHETHRTLAKLGKTLKRLKDKLTNQGDHESLVERIEQVTKQTSQLFEGIKIGDSQLSLEAELENHVTVKALKAAQKTFQTAYEALKDDDTTSCMVKLQMNDPGPPLSQYHCFYQTLADAIKTYPELFRNLQQQTLFNCTLPNGETGYDAKACAEKGNYPYTFDPELQLTPLELSEQSTAGFLQMKLATPEQGFANALFAQVVTTIALFNGSQLIMNQSGGPAQVMNPPQQPFAPVMKAISANYRACYTYDLTQIGGTEPAGTYPLECYYETPFSQYKVYDHTVADGFYSGGTVIGVPETTPIPNELPLYPSSGTQGTLFLPMKEAIPLADLSLYTELASKATEGKIDQPTLQFTYLNKDGWQPLMTRSDTTRSFMCSGILTFNFPADAVTTSNLMPQDSYWICIGVDQNVSDMPQTTYVNANGVLLQRDLDTVPPEFTPELAALQIDKPGTPIPKIATILQPFASFGGEVKETTAKRNVRVSNRLRHKDRVLTHADYYRMALQHFPGLYYCRSQYQRASRSLVLYCAARKADATDTNSFLPLVSDCQLLEIEKFLTLNASGLYPIQAENFVPSYVQLTCEVIPRDSGLQNLLPDEVDEAFKLYLAPWISGNTDTVSIGKTITTQEIARVVTGVANVAGIHSIRLTQLAQDGTSAAKADSQASVIEVKPDTLLVPSMFNTITIYDGE